VAFLATAAAFLGESPFAALSEPDALIVPQARAVFLGQLPSLGNAQQAMAKIVLPTLARLKVRCHSRKPSSASLLNQVSRNSIK
jgi:hypothetical protein